MESAMLAARTKKGFTLIELMVIVAILGILASLAIPAFQKYLRRSRVIEAVKSVRRMFDSSVAYFADEHADRAGIMVPKQFPSSTGPTPSTTCCGHPDLKCPPDSAAFELNPTWDALGFIVSDPHHFIYTYESAGIEDNAQFTARANGDLNCNTLWSTFERVGVIDAAEYVNGTALYKNLPLE
jgi:prepilin-type N-terminal cleavage/methylation domain-containing protein